MTLQAWVTRILLRQEGFAVPDGAMVTGAHGIHVTRSGRPDAYAYCPDGSDTEAFTPEDLDQALLEIPGLEFVVVVRRAVANDTYDHADQKKVAIGAVGDLKSAIHSLDDIATFRSREDKYIRSRLDGTFNVTNYRRRGPTTYEIHRTGSLRTLTVAMVDDYEMTADQVYSVVAAHRGIALDAIITTNPSCRGLAQPAQDAADNASTVLHTFNDFLRSLRDPWTA